MNEHEQARAVERDAIRDYLNSCAAEANRQRLKFLSSGHKMTARDCGTEAKAYANAAAMVEREDHASRRASSPRPTAAEQGERVREDADLEQRAKELLRDAYEREGWSGRNIIEGRGSHTERVAVKAIAHALATQPNKAEAGEALREAADLARRVRDMVPAENAHARATLRDEKAGRHRDATTSRDDVDMIHANLYKAWPAKRLDALLAALSAASPTPGSAA